MHDHTGRPPGTPADDFLPQLLAEPRKALRLNRRALLGLATTAAGGLLLSCRGVAELADRPSAAPAETDASHQLGLFVAIEPNGRTVIGSRAPEIGQGVKTALPMIVAEEMDADWARVEVVQLPLGLVATTEPAGMTWKYGPQGAGGSTSVPGGWRDLRQAGAQVRDLLLRAAAQAWDCELTDLRTDSGTVVHVDGRRVGYGQLAPLAATLPLASEPVALKDPADYRLIGTPRRVVDAQQIVHGRAEYGIDARLPGELVAVVERCPHFEGALVGFDATAALAVPGVRQVLALPGPAAGEPISANTAPGVAVLADHSWAALAGRKALRIDWQAGPWADESSASLDAQAEALLRSGEPGVRLRDDGDFDAALVGAATRIEATYRVPYVSHCPLEPQNACVHVQADRVLIVAPMQMPAGASRMAHQITGIDRSRIEVRMTRVGGGFGRRLSNDFVAEALLLSKATGKPIRLLWSREDDLRHDFFRPFGHHHLQAAVDADGRLSGWAHRLASASKYHRRPGVTEPADLAAPELYADDLPTGLLANVRMEWFAVQSGLLRGSWRAPAHTANAFAVQSFIDEVAHAAGADPLDFRLKLLGQARELPYAQHGGPVLDTGRLAGVLRAVAERIGWGRTLAPGRGLGLACHFTFGGYGAHAIEVSVDDGGDYRIERCVCALDVGRIINPLGLEAQAIGGTIDGLSTARRLETRIVGGQVQNDNFDQYPLLRIDEAPEVEAILIDSQRDPGGAGEMAIPTVAPALANAIFAASGVRLRSMPFAATGQG
jgi:isoquinoline 1-oxidoreductase beta subunit